MEDFEHRLDDLITECLSTLSRSEIVSVLIETARRLQAEEDEATRALAEPPP